VAKLQRHFDQAGEDVRQIRISTEKVAKRAERIEEMDFETPESTDTQLDEPLDEPLDKPLDKPLAPQPALEQE
jgi:DNA recombination protein RmuC